MGVYGVCGSVCVCVYTMCECVFAYFDINFMDRYTSLYELFKFILTLKVHIFRVCSFSCLYVHHCFILGCIYRFMCKENYLLITQTVTHPCTNAMKNKIDKKT